MNSQLYTYSMVRALYDEGEDYIDSFWPFVLKVLPIDKSTISLDVIQDKIQKIYGLVIPQHSLGVIITRAKRKGYVEKSQKKCSLTNDGLSYINKLETEGDVERRINELLEDARAYLSDKYQLTFDAARIKSLIQAFVKENIEFFEKFVNPGENGTQFQKRDKILLDYETGLVDYFTEVERAKPAIFKTLQDIIFGSIVSVIIRSESFAETTKKFGQTNVYLDTNFVFSILSLHFNEYNKPAQELFKLMQQEKSFSFKVFDFTVEEIINVVRNYEKEQAQYLRNVKVGSIFSSLKVKGWTSADVREFIANIEEKLSAIGIKITPTKLTLDQYAPNNLDLISALAKYKPWQGKRGQSHDLAVIEAVKSLRKDSVRQIENAKVLFLTSDARLSTYNYLEGKHRDRGTICEVILDRLLTNLLWLKHPTLIKDLPLGSVISMHSRHLFIDKEVWRRFYITIHDLKQKGDVEEKDIAILLYDKHIHDMLTSYEAEDAGKIKKGWVLENIRDAKLRLDKEKENEIEKQKVEFEKIMSKSEQEREEKIYTALGKMKKAIKDDSMGKARRFFGSFMFLLVLCLIIVFWFVTPIILRRWQTIEPFTWLLSLALPILLMIFGVKLNPWNLRDRLKEWLFNRIYIKKLKVSKLEQLHADLIEEAK